jgi:hypothetical protein
VSKVLVAAMEGNVAIVKMILDRTEGRVQRAVPETCRVEFRSTLPQRLEVERQRALRGLAPSRRGPRRVRSIRQARNGFPKNRRSRRSFRVIIRTSTAREQ